MLAKRIYQSVLAKFDGDKRKGIAYLQEKCWHYARLADRKRSTKFHQQWREVYKAYSSAEFQMSYWLEMDATDYGYPEENFSLS